METLVRPDQLVSQLRELVHVCACQFVSRVCAWPFVCLQAVAKRASALGMKILATRRHGPFSFARLHSAVLQPCRLSSRLLELLFRHPRRVYALQVRLKALVTSCSSKWSCGLRIFGAGFQLLLRSPGLPPVHFIVPLLAFPGPFLDFSWVLS